MLAALRQETTKFLAFNRHYLVVISAHRTTALSCALGSGIAGIFEMVALFAMAPILGFATSLKTGYVPASVISLFEQGGLFSSSASKFILLVFAGTASGAIRWIALKRLVVLRYQIELTLRESLADRLLNMDWQKYHELQAGSINNSFMHGVGNIGEGIENYLRVWANAIIIGVLLTAAVTISPQMALFALVYALAIAVISKIAMRRANPWIRRSVTYSASVATAAHQVFENLKFIRVSGMQGWAQNTLRLAFDQFRSVNIQNLRYSELHRFALDVVGVTFIAFLVAMFRPAEAGALGSFIVFLGLFYRCVPRIQQLQLSYYCAQAKTSWLDWWQLLIEQTSPNAAARRHGASAKSSNFPTDRPPALSFSKVSFNYDAVPGKQVVPILNALSFEVRPAEFLAIVGRSGSGKSTAMGLMLGLLEPTQGEIRVDGVPLRDLEDRRWRDGLGYLPQEPNLFSASILDNIAFGDQNPDRALAIECLETAQAWEFVSKLPDGLDTMVGNRGDRFSGGERQRIALARALYKRPSILFLDEPTSSLDSESIAKLRKALEALKGEMTMILITHQPDLLDIADKVVRLTPNLETGASTHRSPLSEHPLL